MSGEFKEDRRKITCPGHVPDSSEASKAPYLSYSATENKARL